MATGLHLEQQSSLSGSRGRAQCWRRAPLHIQPCQRNRTMSAATLIGSATAGSDNHGALARARLEPQRHAETPGGSVAVPLASRSIDQCGASGQCPVFRNRSVRHPVSGTNYVMKDSSSSSTSLRAAPIYLSTWAGIFTSFTSAMHLGSRS